MSSRELLVLLDGLPDTAKFKIASERTFWVVEYCGEGERDSKLLLMPAGGRPPRDVTLIAEYVDWTHDQKLLSRNVRELASMRADGHGYIPDFTGLTEPLREIVQQFYTERDQRMVNRIDNHIRSGLYGKG